MSEAARHSLFLAVKEALNNVIRHSAATEVELQILQTGDQLQIVVADNGCGFDPNAVPGGNGSRIFRNGCGPCGAKPGRVGACGQSAPRSDSLSPCPAMWDDSPPKDFMTKIAIIEDNPTMRKMLVELVDSAPGYRCVCACSTSKEALAEVPKHQPDVALMDIHLPDESGINCTAKLTEKLPGLQVIMVTVPDIDLIFQALKAASADTFSSSSAPMRLFRPFPKCAGGAPMTSDCAHAGAILSCAIGRA